MITSNISTGRTTQTTILALVSYWHLALVDHPLVRNVCFLGTVGAGLKIGASCVLDLELISIRAIIRLELRHERCLTV
jgi:hypothetical protein